MALMLSAFVVTNNFRQDEVVAEAHERARTTKRIWFFPDYVTWWNSDDLDLGIHALTPAGNNGWPGNELIYDKDNKTHYFDVDINTDTVIFNRYSGGTAH